jgi:hypothetical protein
MADFKFEDLKAGDKVRIVSERTTRMNSQGEMDKWLGKVMTVRGRYDFGPLQMEEDKSEYGGWVWSQEMIAELIEGGN